MKKNFRVIVALVLAGIAWSAYLDHSQQPKPLAQRPCHVVWYQGQAHVTGGDCR